MKPLGPKITSAAAALAAAAWLYLILGLVYAYFMAPAPTPNPVIMFSPKGLDGLLTELAALGIGALGLLLASIAFALKTRSQALTLATAGNLFVCATCLVLLLSH